MASAPPTQESSLQTLYPLQLELLMPGMMSLVRPLVLLLVLLLLLILGLGRDSMAALVVQLSPSAALALVAELR
ncbi:hypothetical protein KEM55_007603, partial [Ascosphaera atra]